MRTESSMPDDKGNNAAFMRKKRRVPVIYGVILAMIISLFSPGSAARAADDDEYDQLREKWRAMLTGGTEYDPDNPYIAPKVTALTQQAQSNWDTMEKAPDRAYLWSDQASETIPGHTQESYLRLKEMALAYSTKGSELENNAELLSDIIGGLEWLYENRYNLTVPKNGNWYNWEIGTPMQLNDIVVLLYDQLSDDQIANYMNAVNRFSAKVSMTGANRLWKAQVVAVSGVITKNSAKIADARDGLSPVFLYVDSGDGFYEDGSFIQHLKHPYNGGYGKALLLTLSKLMYLLGGSSWDVIDPNANQVYEWVYRAFEPLIYRGDMMDMVRGREIARSMQDGHFPGHTVIESTIRLAQFAPAEDAGRLKSMVKEWLTSDTYMNFLEHGPIDSIVQGLDILHDAAVDSRGELSGHYQYAGMDRAVHRRPGFGFGLSMSSSRIYNYESINGENIKGWYTGDGMTYLYNNDQAQYNDAFWPTVNPYRLPGTTVDTRTRTSASGTEYASSSAWTGGVSIQGEYGISGMQLQAFESNLTANKSWFMFDDEVVALGSGITNAGQSGNGWDGTPRKVETTVENRKLNGNGDNAFTVDGAVLSDALGWSGTMTDVSWAHLEGNVPGSDIGYYFPGGDTTVQGAREARTSTWNAINGNPNMIDGTVHTRHYLSLWFDHGTNPRNAGYSYVLLPGKTAAEVGSYAASPNIEVLENSEDAHAVKETTLNVTGVNFWNDNAKTSGGITSNKKASVLMKETDDEVEVAVSDPTQSNAGTVTIELDRSADGIVSIDPEITVLQLSPKIKFTVDVNGAKGRSFNAKFLLGDGDGDFGPRGQWHFDETEGLEAFDASYHGNIGTLLGGPAWTTIGKFGGALDFDGVDDAIRLPNIVNPAESGFTAMAWVRAEASGGSIIGQEGTNGRNWLYMHPDGTLASELGGVTTASASAIDDGGWHHAAVTYDGTTVSLYVDGGLKGSASVAAEPESGGMLAGEGWDGKLDELTVYSRALNESEISTFYDEGATLRFHDDFEDGNAADWSKIGSGNWSVVTTDDSKQYKQSNGSSTAHSVNGNADWSDYSVEAKVMPIQFASGSNHYLGMVARYQDNANKYIFQYSGNLGKLLINKRFKDVSTTIAEKEYTMSVGTVYTLKAVLDGSELRFYVNGVLELSGTDSSLSAGQFGFVTYNTTAQFDDVFADGSPEALSMAPPVLTADTADNDTAHDIEIAFEDDAAWTEALTEVKAGYDVLAKGTEYTVGEGKIVIPAGVLSAGDHMITAAAPGYTVAEVRQSVIGLPSSEADLSALTLSGVSFDLPFSADVTDYAAIVPYRVSTVTATATLSDAEHASAEVRVYPASGTPVYGPVQAFSGEASDPLPLAVGDNRIEWTVTAEDGTTKTYKVTIRRAEYSPVLFEDDFEDGNAADWSKVGSGNWSVVTTDDTKRFRQSNGSSTAHAVNGNADWGDYSMEAKVEPIQFATGKNHYVGMVARYQDNANKYIFQYSGNLGKLLINKRFKDVSTTIAEIDYEMTEGTAYTLKAVLDGSDLRFYVNGALELSGTDSSIATGRFGFVTYNMTAQFDDVVVVDLNAEAPAFTPPGLTADTTDNDEAHDLEITFEDDAAWREAITAVTAGDASLAEGTDYTVGVGSLTVKAGTLPVGDHAIRIEADGYDVAEVIQRILALPPIEPSGQASLSDLRLSRGTLRPGFSPGTLTYTASVPNSVSSITATATVTDSVYATVTASVYGTVGSLVFGPIGVISGEASDPLPLEVGSNRIHWTVTAQNGETRTYAVTVNRADEEPTEDEETEDENVDDPAEDEDADDASEDGSAEDTTVDEPDDDTTTITVNGVQTKVPFAKVTTTDGRSVTRISVDSEQLAGLLQAAGEREVMEFDIAGDEPAVEVELPAAALLATAGTTSDSILQIKTGEASYRLPFNVLKDVPGDATIIVRMAKVSDTMKDEVNEAAERQRLQPLLAHPVEFTVRVDGEELTDFNGTYVERSLAMGEVTDPDKATAVWIDANDVMHFVPSVFRKIGGAWEVTIRSPHDSIYTIVASDRTFADLSGHWAKADVETLANKRIVSGVTNQAFAPDARITRAEFAALLVRSLGLAEAAEKQPFADVTPADWYAGAVGAAYEAGLIAGYEDGSFRPEAPISREQLAVMTARAIEAAGADVRPDAEVPERFSDRSGIADWARDAAAKVIEAGVIQGMTDSIFAAKAYATRAQCAAMLKRMLQYAEFIN